MTFANKSALRRTGIIMTSAELIKNGYASPTYAGRKTFELPDFCLVEHFKHLPLHIQVCYQDTARDYESASVHFLKPAV